MRGIHHSIVEEGRGRKRGEKTTKQQLMGPVFKTPDAISAYYEPLLRGCKSSFGLVMPQ